MIEINTKQNGRKRGSSPHALRQKHQFNNHSHIRTPLWKPRSTPEVFQHLSGAKKKKKLKKMPFSEESEKGQEEQFHFTASPILQGSPAQSQETPWSTVSPLGKQTKSLLPPPLQDAAQKATLSVPPRTQAICTTEYSLSQLEAERK